MKLFLITINYNGSKDTIAFARSLNQQTDPDFSLIIIDNASTPEELIAVEQLRNLPFVNLVPSETNLGFSGGNNVGIRKALQQDADWVLLINNDTHVELSFILCLKQGLKERQGIVGVPLQKNERVAYAGNVAWLKPTLLHQYEPLKNGINHYAIGAGLAIHQGVFGKIGFLDERYFLYFEDADFTLTARKAGISISFLTEPKIHHQISQSTDKLGSPLLLRYHYRNMFLFNQKHAPAHIKILLPLWVFLGIVKQTLKLIFLPSERPESKAIITGIKDYVMGKFGKLHA
ncbi:MAG: glycosyltransferase family 2 protein [Patescibacteria group bacterium]